MFDDLPNLDADGEEGIDVIEDVIGVSVHQAGLPHAGFPQKK